MDGPVKFEGFATNQSLFGLNPLWVALVQLHKSLHGVLVPMCYAFTRQRDRGSLPHVLLPMPYIHGRRSELAECDGDAAHHDAIKKSLTRH